MAYAFVATSGVLDGLTGTTTAHTPAVALAAGIRAYVVIANDTSGTVSVSSVTDNATPANTYTRVGTDVISTADVYAFSLWESQISNPATTVTATYSGSCAAHRISVTQYTGVTGASISAKAYQAAGTLAFDGITSGTLTPGSQPGLLFSYVFSDFNNVAAAGTGFTNRGTFSSQKDAVEDRAISALTAAAGTWTYAATTGVYITIAAYVALTPTTAPAPTGWKSYLKALGYMSSSIAAAVFAAGLDIGGWKTYTPVTTNGVDTATRSAYLTMTGTRLHYVNPSLTVATTMLALDQAATWNATTNPHGGPYLWNGSAIIDMSGNLAPLSGPYSGVAYGTDPMNPSAAVQEFKRVSYSIYDRAGNNRLNGTVQNGAYTSAGSQYHTAASGRNGMPDWWLIKRGTTTLLENDFYDLCLEGNAGLVKTSMYGTLVTPGGTSLSAMSIICAYGPLTAPRPIIKQIPEFGFVSTWGNGKKIEFTAWVSLYFDGHDRSNYSDSRQALNLLYNPGTAANHDVWFEDVTFDGTEGLAIQTNTDWCVDFWRCQIYDTWGANAGSGIYSGNTGLSQVNFHSSILARNGKNNDPVLNNGGTDNTHNRNFYQGYECSKDAIIDDTLFLPGGSGEQFRAGGILNNTYFLSSGVSYAAENGAPYGSAQVNTGSIQNCVFERYYQAIVGGAGGLAVFWGPHNVDIFGNITTDAGMTPADRVTYSTGSAGGNSFGGYPFGWYHDQLGTMNNCRMHGGVVINRGGAVSWNTSEGVNLSGRSDVVTSSGFASWSQTSGPVYASTTTAIVAAAATVVPVAATTSMVVGQNFHVTQTDASVFLTRITAISGLNITIAAGLPVGAASGAAVNATNYIHYQYPLLSTNTIDYNTVIGQSNTDPNAKTFTLAAGGAITPTDTRSDSTTYANNTYMSLAQASAAGYNIDRCLASYLTGIGFPLSATDQFDLSNQLVAYLKANMRKGYYDSRFTGKPIVNHVRTGVGMAALP